MAANFTRQSTANWDKDLSVPACDIAASDHTPIRVLAGPETGKTFALMQRVARYRVSTRAQGSSGLGLEGQVSCVEAYATANHSKILASYQEVESGRNSDRPMLALAIAHAKRSGAILIIAKIDRGSCNYLTL